MLLRRRDDGEHRSYAVRRVRRAARRAVDLHSSPRVHLSLAEACLASALIFPSRRF